MKRLLAIALLLVLVFGTAGHAMASFEAGGLTVTVYKSDGKEVGFDPGRDHSKTPFG